MAPLLQEALCCPCGSMLVNRHGRCAKCDRRRRLSSERFGGQREAVLLRDGARCRGCGEVENFLVHHRRPGTNSLRWLLTLCRRCHVRIHRTYRPGYSFPPELRELWREVNRGLAEQLDLNFIPDSTPSLVQVPLFLEAAA